MQIESVEIEDSLVLDDAQIRFLDMRVDGSVIGPRVKLIRDFRFRRGLRVSVGESTELMLS